MSRVGSSEIKACIALASCVGLASGEAYAIEKIRDILKKQINNGDTDRKTLIRLCDYCIDTLIKCRAERECFEEAIEALAEEAPQVVEIYREAVEKMDESSTADINDFMDRFINEKNVSRKIRRINRERELDGMFRKED